MTPKGGGKRKPAATGRHVPARHTQPRGAGSNDGTRRAGPGGAPSRATGGRSGGVRSGSVRSTATRGGRGGGEGTDQQWRKTSVGELGGDQVEGRRAVLELLATGRRQVHDIWISDSLEPSHQLDEIEDTAQRMRVPVETVPRTRLEAEARTDAPQGVLAHARAIEAVSLEDLCQRSRDGSHPFLLVAAGVTDPHNLGALLRSAECAGVTGVVLPRHRAVHLSPTVTKVAAGAIEHLDFCVVGGIPAALEQLTKLDVWSIGLAGETDQSLFQLPLGDGPVALVVGSEGKGLAPLVRKRCDALAAIPQHGSLPSLNVSVAGAVAFFEVARQRALRAH
jgi:23S rRNA (guanosine2251-2'-O)-methyltransferase